MSDNLIKQVHIFFAPESVAVIGASRKIRKAGHVIFKNFVDNKRRGVFKGRLYPVNPREDYILGFKCYPSILDIPGEVELIVIVVPAEAVLEVMHQAAKKGVKAAVVITAGFSEVGNYKLEEEMVKIAKKAGIRVLGPNCLGVYDSNTGVDMLFLPETKILSTGDEMIATPRPMAGNISIVTQSGAFGASILDFLAGRQLGINKFVSFGNRCDVEEAEVLEYMLHDEQTHVILLYIEGIRDGRKFMEVAKKVTMKKPIVALKTGRTSAGARAAVSHTGSMVGTDDIYEAAFMQCGVIRARDMVEFFNIGKALAYQPPAKGDNIGIVTDAGGPGIMAADECELIGLKVRRFSDRTMQKFDGLKRNGKLPAIATNVNPVDLTGLATSEMFEIATEVLFEDSEIDGIIILGLHHVPALTEIFVDKIAYLARKYLKPIVACDIGETEMAIYIKSRFDKFRIPSYGSPEDAARAMRALVRYGQYLRKHGYFKEYLKLFHKRSGKLR